MKNINHEYEAKIRALDAEIDQLKANVDLEQKSVIAKLTLHLSLFLILKNANFISLSRNKD